MFQDKKFQRGFLKLVTLPCHGDERQKYSRPSCSSTVQREQHKDTEEDIMEEEVAMETCSVVSLDCIESPYIFADMNDNVRQVKITCV